MESVWLVQQKAGMRGLNESKDHDKAHVLHDSRPNVPQPWGCKSCLVQQYK